jgi:hypothetical protein
MKSMTILISSRCFLLSLGARSVLPMVVAPEAIVESFFLSIGSSILSSHLLISIILALILSGLRQALPMGVAPKAIRGVLASCYRLKYLFWTAFSFLYFINSFFYIFLLLPLLLTEYLRPVI